MRFHSLLVLVGVTSLAVTKHTPILPHPPPASTPAKNLIHDRSQPGVPVSLVDGELPSGAPYWLEQIKHQGISAFNSAPDTYQVFRNVKSFGAKGMFDTM